jgi:predicted dehydrogenase
LQGAADRFGINEWTTSFDALLSDPDIDVIHLVSPIPQHAKQSIAALKSGKHCACTVPMATSLEDIQGIIAAVKESGKNYSMMETQIYHRITLWVKEVAQRGEFGKIQLLRGAHYQDMENWPSYWAGLPPMWYATHAISPIFDIANTRAISVTCLGTGYMREELQKQYGNPFPIETAQFRMENGIAAEVTRALFYSAREYCESYNIYGDDACFEWPQFEGEKPVLFHQTAVDAQPGPRSVSRELIDVPDYAHLLPEEIQRFTQHGVYDENNPHRSFMHGGGHGGSHPHMVNEFVKSIVENRKAYVDEIKAANWTAAGICAHESAMQDGALIKIPSFTNP